jgi:sigma-B regulation protein RsbU (phosphoserine phosphatase)
MTIRQKLLLLLLLFSVTPLIVGSTLGRWTLRSLGDRIVNDTRNSLIAGQERDLLLLSSAYADVIQTRGREVERGLLLFAEFARDALTSPPPIDAAVYDARADFGALGNPVPGLIDRQTGEKPTGPVEALAGPMPSVPGVMDVEGERVHISYAAMSTLFLDDADDASGGAPVSRSERALADAARLSTLLPLCRTLLARMSSPIEGMHISTVSSRVHVAYPGHSAYPATYDPRSRPWFEVVERAAASDDDAIRFATLWSGPVVDVRTRELMMSLSKGVYNEAGELLAVASVDSRLSTLLEGLPELAEWSESARGFVTTTPRDSTIDRARINRLARNAGIDPGHAIVRVAERGETAAGRSWSSPVDVQLLILDGAEDRETLAELMIRREPGIVRASFNGDAVLVAATPFRPDDVTDQAYLVLVVPTDAIEAPADTLAATLAGQVTAQIATNGGVAIVVIVIVIVAGYVASRSVTRPVRELATTAERIAAGDLDARADVDKADELGRLASTFNAMVPQLRDRLRMRESLNLAMDVQRHLLPSSAPAAPGLDVAGASNYCDETGGDYFDFVDLTTDDARRLGVAIGDVTGHGVAAALLMTTARAMLRSRVVLAGSLAEQLTDVNRQLARDAVDGRFMTLAFFIFDTDAGVTRYVNAGHDPAFVYDPTADHVRELHTAAGLPLGVLDDFTYSEQSRPLPVPGEIVLLGTDGIWEARDPSGAMFGKDRLKAVIRAHHHRSARDICDAVLAAVREHHATNEQADDVTLVVIKGAQAADHVGTHDHADQPGA